MKNWLRFEQFMFAIIAYKRIAIIAILQLLIDTVYESIWLKIKVHIVFQLHRNNNVCVIRLSTYVLTQSQKLCNMIIMARRAIPIIAFVRGYVYIYIYICL